MTRAETPATELDAALDRLERLCRYLGRAEAQNDVADALGINQVPTDELELQIARQREIVRRIANGEQE